MRFDGLVGWIGASVFGVVLIAGFVLVLNDQDTRARSAPPDAAQGATQRQRAIALPDLDRLAAERDAAQAAFRAAERQGQRGAITTALDRFNAASRRYSDAKLRHLQVGD